MKPFVKALLIGLLLMYVFSYAIEHLWHISLSVDDDVLAPFAAAVALITVFAVLVWIVFLVLMGVLSLLIAIPVLVLALPLLLLGLPLILMLVGAWPLVLCAVVIYLIVRKENPRYSTR